MRKSIKKMVFFRVIAALLSILLFSGVTTFNLIRIEKMQKSSAQTVDVLSRAQSAETAHYKWSSNLSKALYAGGEFPGTDDTKCVLGQWIYGEAGTDDEQILALRQEIQPMHKALHQSVAEVQNMMAASPVRAQNYYQETIQNNLTTLVGKLDQVKSGGTLLNQRFLPSLLKREEDISKLASLIRSYFALGGHHIQFNIVDTETLYAAQKCPEDYRDLLVRVAGYSDYFNDMNADLQADVIARTEQESF